jgi:hypothetical protein
MEHRTTSEGVCWHTDDTVEDAKSTKAKAREEALLARLLATLDRLQTYLDLQMAKEQAREAGRQEVLAAVKALFDKVSPTQSTKPGWAMEMKNGR